MVVAVFVCVVTTTFPFVLLSTILVVFGVGVAVGVGVTLRPNRDSKKPFFLVAGVGVTVTIFGVGVTLVSLKASSLSERFTRDPNTNKNTSTTIRPRTNEVTLLKPLMAVL